MSHIKVTPVVAVNKTQLRDDVIETALANGYTEQDVERWEKMVEYRKEYSHRPEVVEKRKLYSKLRYLKMKKLNELLKAMK